jgi:hypothetical protein
MKNSRKHPKSDSRVDGDDRKAPLNSTSPNQLSAPNAARRYLERGFAPIPLPSKSKAPSVKAWPEFRVTAAEVRSHFTKGDNVGLLLGEASGWLVDVDIDADEAILHAARFFPKTALVSGRASRPNSHLWFRSKLSRTIQFQHAGTMILELRSSGSQTIVAPSLHPDGEPIGWSSFGKATEIEPADLHSRAAALASAVVLGRAWPKKGQRNKAALSLAGFLLQRDVHPARARRLIFAAALIASDDGAASRKDAVTSTEKKLRAGDPVTGEAVARTLFGDDTVSLVARWISESNAPDDPSRTTPANVSPSSKADKLIVLASDVRLFSCSTDGGQAYGSVTIEGRQETWKLSSSSMRGFLAQRYFHVHGKAVGRSAIDDAISVLSGQALHGRVCEPVALRVAEVGEVLYIDLGDHERHVVAVTAQGWRLTQTYPVHFVRPSSMSPLPAPHTSGDLARLRDFVNVETENDWRLLVMWLVCTYHPRGPYLLLSISGSQGSAKSTLSESLKLLSDPDQATTRSAPRNPRDLAIAAQRNHVLALDNLSSISRELSDALCRLSTGGAFATRRLYSDDEESLFNATRPVILNGIPDLLGQPDLLDRAVHLILPKIRASKRRDLERFRAEFEAARPALFGAILDALVGILRNLPEVKIERLPRMADFCRWGVALEMHLGHPAGGFMRAYAENRRATSLVALDENVLVKPIKYYLKLNRGSFKGSASTLLHGLNRLSFKWIEELRRSPDWPRKPNRLSAELRRIGPYLAEAGIRFESGRDARDSVRNRYIILRRFKKRLSKRVAELVDDDPPPLLVRRSKRRVKRATRRRKRSSP